MSKNLLHYYSDSGNFGVSLDVPSDLDYWTINGNRVNFYCGKLQNPKHLEYSGFSLVLWIFSFKIAWKPYFT